MEEPMSDEEILDLPHRLITGGPYRVLCKHWYSEFNYGWALCTLDWEHRPRLGLRYTSRHTTGFPFGLWFVVPEELQETLLHHSGIEDRADAWRFLNRESTEGG